MSVYEYWIGQGIDLDKVWQDFEAGKAYERKFHQTTCHLLEIEFASPPSSDPILAFEAIFKTTKRYFHDMKQLCLSPDEYDQAAPLFFYGINRGSAIWQWLGELRQLLLFGTNLADEKLMGQQLENIDKKLAILSNHFGSQVNPKDFDAFMKAKAAPELDAAIQRLLKQKIKRVSISLQPIQQLRPSNPNDLIDLGRLGENDRG